jgi:hypothetical protein
MCTPSAPVASRTMPSSIIQNTVLKCYCFWLKISSLRLRLHQEVRVTVAMLTVRCSLAVSESVRRLCTITLIAHRGFQSLPQPV